MRALAITCLLLATLFTFPGTAEAQLSRLLGFENASHGRQANAGRIGQQRAARGSVTEPSLTEHVQPVQFMEAIPSAVGEAVPAMDRFDTVVPPVDMDGYDAPAPSPYPAADAASVMLPAPEGGGTVVSEVESSEMLMTPTAPETILDSEYGQPYDIPLGDVIPSAATEVFSTNNWFRGGRWFSQQEVVMLLRADLPNLHVAVEPTATATNLVIDPLAQNSLSSKDADFTFEAGAKFTLGKVLGRDVANRDHSIDFRFMGFFDFAGSATIAEASPDDTAAADDPDGISVLGIESLLGTLEANSTLTGVIGFNNDLFFNSVPGFDASLSQNIVYESDLNSFEVNYSIGGRPARDRMVMQPDGRWVRHATPSVVRGVYAGLRYVRQNERFQYTANGRPNATAITDANGNVFGVFTGSAIERGRYVVETDNDLVGIQIGGEFVQKRTDWIFGVDGRIGGLVNFADRSSLLRQITDQEPLSEIEDLLISTQTQDLQDETLAFLGEANLYMAYYLRPNTSVRFGYSLMYLNGLATATNNAGLKGTFPRFELTGDALYHGLNAGFNMTW